MLGKLWQKLSRAFWIVSLAIALLNAASCSRSNATTTFLAPSNKIASGDIVEVSPPETIQTLRRDLEIYQPQVTIVSPEVDEVFQNDQVEVRLQIRDLPIFKSSELELGPHLHVIVDNQPYIAVYDLSKPLILPDLEPGTHTLRVFAARPWHESFKNAGAYAQTTFHIFTKTQNNNPDPALPLLTYSRPKGTYGAEPILLDFYLTNAPLRLAATENNLANWRIRCTINGQSFVLDSWQSIYLTGFKPGKNWIKLEFIDSQGNFVKNVFNNTARTITYDPKSKDTLSQLVTGEISADVARGIVDQDYTVKIPLPSPTETPTPEVEVIPPIESTPELLPTPTETPTPEPILPIEPTPELLPTPTEIPTSELPSPTETPNSIQIPKTSTDTVQKLGSYFRRSRRTGTKPRPAPNLPSIPEIPASTRETPSLNLAPETPVTELD